MTHRTEGSMPSKIEKATQSILQDISTSVTNQWASHGVQITETQFRSIIAGYFAGKDAADWCYDLGIQPSESDIVGSRNAGRGETE